ncbi:MAG: tRNA (adenosine(37)-N6)-dimethylallyltransferase MiaA [Bdellovibrionota bacterium]
MSQPFIAFLVGPTASGKSKIALELAQKHSMEIINADRMQVYRHLTIGTAKPSSEDFALVPHHLFDLIDPDQSFSAMDYATMAREVLNDQGQEKKYLFVGGSGFYLKALLYPPQDLPKGVAHIEDYVQAYRKILEKDPELKSTIHENDHYRIQRAFFLVSQGYTPSQLWKQAADQKPRLQVHWFGIQTPRPQLLTAIAHRSQTMVDQGLMEETQKVLEQFPASKPQLEKIIGYKQCLDAIENSSSMSNLVQEIARATGKYAKQQMTWFKRNPEILWSSLEHAQDSFSCYIEKETRPS